MDHSRVSNISFWIIVQALTKEFGNTENVKEYAVRIENKLDILSLRGPPWTNLSTHSVSNFQSLRLETCVMPCFRTEAQDGRTF